MAIRPVLLLSLIAAADLGAQTVVANYRNDFNESGAPNPGWSYLWNAPSGWAVGTTGDQASGFIGMPSGYRALSLVEGDYTADGDTIGGNNAPSGFLRLSATGGHPGVQAGAANKRARYAIAAYTVPSSGHYAIGNSFISMTSGDGDGVEVLVFPGKSEAVQGVMADPAATTYFDVEIGYLDAGQTIYVAFGPGETAAFDSFLMDFNIVRTDRLSLKQQLINGVASGNDVITILPGRYYANLSSTYHTISNFKPAVPVTIIADGVELISQSPNRVLGFTNCSNITLRGLSIDYDPQLYRQGTVESINNNVFQVRLHEGYPPTLSSSGTSGIIYDQSNLWMKQLTSTFYPTAISQVEPGLYAVTTSSRLTNLSVGNYVSLTEPINIPHALYLENCTGMRLEDVELHGAPAFALLSRTGYQIALENVRVTPGATPVRATVPRLLSSNADGLHFKYSRGEIHINNCHLAYLGDDGIILTSSYSPIIEKSQANAITIATKSKEEILAPGDNLYLYNPTTGTREEATIQSVAKVALGEEAIRAQIAALFPKVRLTNSTFEQAYLITLSSAVTAPVGGWTANRSGDSSGFTVTNNSIDNTRARGILIKASNGIVRGNEVFNSFLAGIQLRPEAEIWMEGDYSQNVTIEENELRRCAIGLNNAHAPIYVSAEGAPKWTPGSGHVNISIMRNRIYNAPSASIFVGYADDVLIRSNRFTTSHNFTNAFPFYTSAIRLEKANNVRIDGVNLAVGINQSNANMAALIGVGANVTGLDVVAGVSIDNDKDLLPDDWEIQYFGNTAVADANDDFDGDGLTEAEEFLALLNPLVPDAFSAHIVAGSGLRLTWDPKANRFITVYANESLDGPFAILAKDIPAEAGAYTLPAMPEGGRMFYQVQISD